MQSQWSSSSTDPMSQDSGNNCFFPIPIIVSVCLFPPSSSHFCKSFLYYDKISIPFESCSLRFSVLCRIQSSLYALNLSSIARSLFFYVSFEFYPLFLPQESHITNFSFSILNLHWPLCTEAFSLALLRYHLLKKKQWTFVSTYSPPAITLSSLHRQTSLNDWSSLLKELINLFPHPQSPGFCSKHILETALIKVTNDFSASKSMHIIHFSILHLFWNIVSPWTAMRTNIHCK